MCSTDPFVQLVPAGRGVVEHDVGQRQRDLPEEVVAAEHVCVPHAEPQCPRGQRGQRLHERQRLLEHGAERVLLHLRLPLASFGLVR